MRPLALALLLALGCAKPPAASPPMSAELKRGLELYAKFPPPEWGPHVVERIAARAINRPVITPDQREFVENFQLWDLARKHVESGGSPR